MRRLVGVAVLMAALILSLSFTAHYAAANERAEELARKCSGEGDSPRKTLGRTHCISYITGMVDAYSLIAGVAPQAKFLCLPEEGISGDQAVKIFVKWVKNHPEGQDMPAKSAALVSLGNAFPCRKK